MSNIYFESIVQVALQFQLVVKEIDRVLVVQDGPVPQAKDDEDIFGLGKVQKGPHVIYQCARSVWCDDVAVAIVGRRVGPLDVQPNAFQNKTQRPFPHE